MSSPIHAKGRKRKNLKDPRIARAHWFYTFEDVKALYGVSGNTLRSWMSNGLEVIEAEKRLFLGRRLNEFHARRRKQAKRPCSFGEIYCVCCKQKHSLISVSFSIEWSGKFKTAISVKCPETGKRARSFVSESDLERLRELRNSKSSAEIPD